MAKSKLHELLDETVRIVNEIEALTDGTGTGDNGAITSFRESRLSEELSIVRQELHTSKLRIDDLKELIDNVALVCDEAVKDTGNRTAKMTQFDRGRYGMAVIVKREITNSGLV